jgi:hypothetical protein
MNIRQTTNYRSRTFTGKIRGPMGCEQRRRERKGLIIFRKNALLFFVVLPEYQYFWWIESKE